MGWGSLPQAIFVVKWAGEVFRRSFFLAKCAGEVFTRSFFLAKWAGEVPGSHFKWKYIFPDCAGKHICGEMYCRTAREVIWSGKVIFS
jgi:hypothetical protein